MFKCFRDDEVSEQFSMLLSQEFSPAKLEHPLLLSTKYDTPCLLLLIVCDMFSVLYPCGRGLDHSAASVYYKN